MAGRDFFSYTTAIPYPGDAPVNEFQQEQAAAANRRETQRFETWRIKHEAWLKAQETEREAMRDRVLAQQAAALKAERHASYLAAGFSAAQFESMWPSILHDAKLEAANSDPLEPERQRLLASGNYGI